MKRTVSILLILALMIPCFAFADVDLYGTTSTSNSYEYTLDTFTLDYCLPAQMLNSPPTVTNCAEDPYGLTWVVFAFEAGVVQLTGKNWQGQWKCARWSDIDPSYMYIICYCLCGGFNSVYTDNGDFAICLYSSTGDHAYITNKASADSFVKMIDEWMTDE